ncbi:sigma-70 family RNA polymerase sigma factor [Aneurinibacillus terranovensis]|uniref:sigma-70 family RNA polymerase sigma factor n=1 Tax=Aneurinibacillus terranovensis TaxID=278991 RepID=UPI0005597785|nr:sigma-70 family RNA polymerase sigma factor [Aneurinibacillus terranovensis]
MDELIQLTVAGDRNAFEEIYQRTVPSIYRTVHFLIGESSDAEDVIQEIYIQVYKSLPKFKAGHPFQPWVTGIAVRQVNTYRRKRWRKFGLLQKAAILGREVETDFSEDVVKKLENRELLLALEKLPYKLKQVIILLYLNEYSQEEVAGILGIPLGTVKSRLSAGLKKLRGTPWNMTPMLRKVEKRNGY